MIVIVDYQCGNLRSVQQALEACGGNAVVSSRRKDIERAKKLVLPGVGSFPVGMANLRSMGLEAPLIEVVESGVPLLGICLGMQLLFDSSTEHGGGAGLGLIEGKVEQIEVAGRTVKLPNVGWVPLRVEKIDTLLQDEDYFYFVHSYHALPKNQNVVLATAEYEGMRFCAAVSRGSIWGMQFHPENSSIAGLDILRRFVEL